MNTNIFNPQKWVIYLLLLVVVIFPILNPLGIAIKPSSNTQQAYDYVEKMEEGATVLVVIAYEPGSIGELSAQVTATLKHFASKNLKVLLASANPNMVSALGDFMTDTYGKAGKVYGEDYLILGYYAGGETTLAAMGDSLIDVFKTDNKGVDLKTFKLTKEITKLPDLDLVFAISNGDTLTFIRQANTKFGIPILFSVVAVMAPSTIPFVQSGQAVSVLVGSSGAAEYETLLNEPGLATANMDAQSLSHIMIIVLILWGNIGYFIERSKEKAKKGA